MNLLVWQPPEHTCSDAPAASSLSKEPGQRTLARELQLRINAVSELGAHRGAASPHRPWWWSECGALSAGHKDTSLRTWGGARKPLQDSLAQAGITGGTRPSMSSHFRRVEGLTVAPTRIGSAFSKEQPKFNALFFAPFSLIHVLLSSQREATCHTIFTDSIQPPHYGPGTCTYSDKHNLAKTNLFTAARCKYESTFG